MFLNALVTTLFKMVILAAVAFCGIRLGKKIRDHKDAKSEKEV